jgi:ribonuclease P protein component
MPSEKTKIGIITSKRLGSAVKRNRIRRRTREAITKVIDRHGNAEIVLIPNNVVGTLNFADLTIKFDLLLTKALNDV